MHRRTFITSLAAASAAEILGSKAWALSPLRRKPRVIVAGAGIAGLFTADLLVRQGCDVQILEASGRIGGKIQGGRVGPAKFDFGAQGFSKDMFRVKALGKRFGLRAIETPDQVDFFLRGETKITGAQYDKEYQGVDDLTALSITMYGDIDDPATRALYGRTPVIEWALKHLPPESVDMFRSTFTADWCDSPERVSLLHYLEASRAYYGDVDEIAFRFREGMFALVDGLQRGLRHRIHLNSPVKSVEAQGDRVIVRTACASMTADAVVMAVPLPQLKKIPITGLDLGALPAALSRFESASVRKIIAVYDRPFWKECYGEFSDPNGLSIMDNSDEDADVYSVVMFLGGPEAERDPSKEHMLGRLAKVIGNEALNPIAYHDHAWLSTEYLPGGYSSNRLVADTGSEVLPTTIGRIFLAGSETATILPTYVEGALSSAERAAQDVLLKLKHDGLAISL